MKDRIFSGPDVEEALASAAASLGLPKAELRYVVLEAGTEGGRGLKPTPARIAVLLQEPGAARTARAEAPPAAVSTPAAGEPLAEIRSIVRAVAAAGGLELEVSTEEEDEVLLVHLRGADCDFLLEPSGRGEVLLAFEHLLQRRLGPTLFPRSVRVRCEGFRESRDKALGLEARQLAADVLETGQARTMEPLNAYERRIVHLALQEVPGVTSFSTGEGRDRRVTVAPRPETPPVTGSADGR